MNIFVTGASGFLGRHLCGILTQAGETVVGLQRDWKVTHASPIVDTIVHGDIRDRALIERTLVEYEIDAVIHLAAQAQVSIGASSPVETFDVNFSGTLSVLDACRQQKIKRVIVASTDKVYGSALDVTEESPLAERGPYGASKACADLLAQSYQQSGLNVAITRCGNLYGPGHLNFSTLIPGTIKRLLTSNEKPLVRFGGRAIRDFLHVNDAALAYVSLLMQTDVVGPINFSGSEPKMIMAIVRELLALAGKPETYVEVQEDGPGEIQSQSLNCYRAKSELNWTPHVRLQDGLKTTFDWYKGYLGVKACA